MTEWGGAKKTTKRVVWVAAKAVPRKAPSPGSTDPSTALEYCLP